MHTVKSELLQQKSKLFSAHPLSAGNTNGAACGQQAAPCCKHQNGVSGVCKIVCRHYLPCRRSQQKESAEGVGRHHSPCKQQEGEQTSLTLETAGGRTKGSSRWKISGGNSTPFAGLAAVLLPRPPLLPTFSPKLGWGRAEGRAGGSTGSLPGTASPAVPVLQLMLLCGAYCWCISVVHIAGAYCGA